jgi:hypothetical protein
MRQDEVRRLGTASYRPKRSVGANLEVRLLAGYFGMDFTAITRHTMPSNFPANSLKTKKSGSHYSTHNSRVAKLVSVRQSSLIPGREWQASVSF